MTLESLGLHRHEADAQRDVVLRLQAQMRLASHALAEHDMPALMDLAATDVAAVLASDASAVLESLPDEVAVRAGRNLPEGILGARLQGAPEFLRTPAVVLDVPRHATLGGWAPFAPWHGAALSPIGTRQGPWGALSVHTFAPRVYTVAESAFMADMAGILGQALGRSSVLGSLREQREGLRQQLGAARRELGAIEEVIAHDMRTSLRTVGGFGDLLALRHGQRLPPEAQRMLTNVRQGARDMDGIVTHALDLLRMLDEDLQLRTVDISSMAEDVLASLALATGRRVAHDVEPGLEARADPRLVRLLLEKLLDNAWKFTAPVAGPLIRLVRRDDVFSVADNGIGFDMAYADKLFRPFQRIHRPGQFEGQGMGLAIAARIVRRHRGRIWAESEPGRGARFHFTLG